MMVDVSQRCMKTNVLGNEVSMPIGIAPTAMQRMAHPDGECATAKAAEGRFNFKIILVAFNYFYLNILVKISFINFAFFRGRNYIHPEYYIYVIHRRNCGGSTNGDQMVSTVHL